MKRIVVLLGFLALAVPATASAHASLGSASPDFRERLASAPRQVVLHFSQVVRAIPNGIVVRDETGKAVSGKARVAADGRTLIAPLDQLPQGVYAVRWQTLSASDGHIVSGLYTFGVGVDAPPPTEAVGVSGPSTIEKLVRWLSYLGLAILAGGLAFRLLVLPSVVPQRLEQAFFALSGLAVVVVLDTGIAALLLRASAALQLPFERFLYADLSPFVGGTRFGVAWVWMTLGSVLVALLLIGSWVRRSRRPLWPALALSLALGSGFSLAGHSASEPNSTAATIVTDWLHISAASLWVGGLVMLAAIGWRFESSSRPSLFLRFSRLATTSVAVVLGAGSYLAIVRLPAAGDLWSTGYGRLLIVKIAFVVLALAWGALHKLVVAPRLARGEILPGGRIGRSLLGESIAGAAVLLVAALLVNSAPPEPLPQTELPVPSASATG